MLSTDGTAFFDKQASDKLAAAPLFTEDGSQPWRRHIWAREVRAAVAKVNAKAKGAARIPAGASAYSFRHARISELLQVARCGPADRGAPDRHVVGHDREGVHALHSAGAAREARQREGDRVSARPKLWAATDSRG